MLLKTGIETLEKDAGLDGVKGWALWGGPVLRTDDAVRVWGTEGCALLPLPPQWGLTVASERERVCSGKTCSNAVEMSLVRQGDESLTVRSLATTLGSHALHAEFSPFGLRLAQETLQRWEHRNLLWKETLVNTKRAGVFVYSQDLFL